VSRTVLHEACLQWKQRWNARMTTQGPKKGTALIQGQHSKSTNRHYMLAARHIKVLQAGCVRSRPSPHLLYASSSAGSDGLQHGAAAAASRN
jgi:hypothetical protein